LQTRVISEGSGTLEARFLDFVVFTTGATGTVAATVDWTFATNDVDIYLTRGSDPCTVDDFNSRTCAFLAAAETGSAKPERLNVAGLAAGTYTLYVGNHGPTDESVAWQVTLTSTSASSVTAASSGVVPRGAAKGAWAGKGERR
jgi:hypothetical protein